MPYKDSEKAREQKRRYYKANREKLILVATKNAMTWRKNNPEKYRERVRNYRKRLRETYPEKAKRQQIDWNLRTDWGITLDEYNHFLFRQNGVCAICKKTCKSGRRLAVDHDHKTNHIRGLLCMNCNNGLGRFLDSTVLLISAIEYLNKPNP